jgi:multidrug resistance efflux pump
MKKINMVGVMATAILILLIIMNFTSGGFRSANSIILARSIMVTSTIDGKVDNKLPEIGQKVNKNDLLVSLLNGRIDKSRLVEYQSQMTYIKGEIEAAESQRKELDNLYTKYRQRADEYEKWMIKDTMLKKVEQSKQLKEAQKISEVNTQKADRFNKLYKNHHASNANVQQANADAIIAKTKVEITSTQLKRSQLLLDSISKNGVFFEDGEASYWEKMLDTINIRQLDSTTRLHSLRSELSKLKIQKVAEQSRIDSSFEEKLLAPFQGIVSSIYVNKDTNVSSGTSLLQILDCSNPVVIIPIPEHKIGDFSIGMKVSINPIDSNHTFTGKISYISSGPMLASDKSMFLQSDMTLNGNKAIVSIDDLAGYNRNARSCDISRKAIVVIHT